MNGGADDRHERRDGRSWPSLGTEFDPLFSQWDARLGASPLQLGCGLLGERVPLDQVASLMDAYRRAQIVAHELRLQLDSAGISGDEFADLCGTVDAQGRPIVEMGLISLVTAEHLTMALRGSPGRPTPPTHDGRGLAA